VLLLIPVGTDSSSGVDNTRGRSYSYALTDSRYSRRHSDDCWAGCRVLGMRNGATGGM